MCLLYSLVFSGSQLWLGWLGLVLIWFWSCFLCSFCFVLFCFVLVWFGLARFGSVRFGSVLFCLFVCSFVFLFVCLFVSLRHLGLFPETLGASQRVQRWGSPGLQELLSSAKHVEVATSNPPEHQWCAIHVRLVAIRMRLKAFHAIVVLLANIKMKRGVVPASVVLLVPRPAFWVLHQL